MFKIGMTDRLSLYIIILFYSGAFIVGYNFLNKDYDQKILEVDNNKRLVHLVLIKFKDQRIIKKKYKIIMYSGNLGLAHDYKTFLNGYKKFNKAQIKCLIEISKKLIKKYRINKKNILGHSDI